MNIEKKVMANLTKCYSIAPLTYRGREHILVAAEKKDPCYLFDTDGNLEDTVWEGPGGVMSMVQVPGSDGVFLATHKFYSPNDSKEAKIVVAAPVSGENWQVRTLAELPHVHRFDIVSRNGFNYLIACTLKSGHEYKNDWSKPGKVYAAVLPESLDGYDEGHQLKLEVVKDGMLKNHGYYRIGGEEGDTCLIACDSGVYQFIPPEAPGKAWEIRRLTEEAASDAVLVDMDQDGIGELAVISPFHGQHISFYKHRDAGYEKIYSYDRADFAHAIYGGMLAGRPSVVIGHREGERSLLLFTYDKEKESYRAEVLDTGCGPANVCHYMKDGKDVLIAANREIDEVAMYKLSDK